MPPDVTWPRILLGLLTVGLIGTAGILYVLSLESAHMYPEVAHLRVPVYLAIVAGLIPILLGVVLVFRFLGLAEGGQAFSRHTVRLFDQMKVLLGITAGYMVVGLVGVLVALGHESHPSIILGWLAVEVVLLFLVSIAALLKSLFAKGLELREGTELTV